MDDHITQTKSQAIDKLLASLSSADFDLYGFMDLTVKEMLNITPAKGAVIELVDNDEMVYRAATGTMASFLGLRLPRQGSMTGLCVEKKEILYSEDAETDPRVNLDACREVGARSMVVAPLFHLQNSIGVLKIISDKPKAFSQQDIEVLQQVAGCLGNALAGQLYQNLRDFI